MAHKSLGTIPHPSGSMGSNVGGDPPVAPPVGIDQTKIVGTPNSNASGPPTFDQWNKPSADAFRESPNANLPAGVGGEVQEGGPVTRLRMPEHDGQKPGEGDIGLVTPSTFNIMRTASEGASVIAPNRADLQTSEAEMRADPEFMNDHRNATAQDHAEHDAYLLNLTKQAIDAEQQKKAAGQNMAPEGR